VAIKAVAEATVAEAVTAEVTKVAAEAATVAEAVTVVAIKAVAEAATKVEVIAAAIKAEPEVLVTKVISHAVDHGRSVKNLRIGHEAVTTVQTHSIVVQAIPHLVEAIASLA
ncbi:MAG: hypothetical protein NWQ40_04210, partial [Schleiferiaceae bacterium]|nr:hypothetical protein [Schleiferiaceae bacterium]